MSLLLPEIYGTSSTEEVYSLAYSLPEVPSVLAWNGNLLAVGHRNGVSILTPIPNDSALANAFPSRFQSDWCFQNLDITSIKRGVTDLKFNSKYLVTVHEDNTLTLVNHLDDSDVAAGGLVLKGHSDFVNGVDIAENGSVVSISDDKTVRVWNDEQQDFVFRTDGIPTLVKFWIDNESDKVIVVENDQVVRVLDYKRKQWLYTIYPTTYSSSNTSSSSIRDVLVHNDKITVIGSGWQKTYSPHSLKGGSGITFPDEETQLTGWLVDSHYIHSSNSLLIGGISAERSAFYDLTSNNNQSYQFKLALPSTSIQAGSINPNGIVAVGSGVKLLVIRPFDSYEALQYDQ